ncbi:hypothetical protein CC86DRAFT_94038 [Ophiobolus disseminans]|uniref:Uncharacterized protein n=1 Tax=Ophiobolus disseminans TaxID=1469910 RepID=A0A6A6ZNW4_9PLEO|nr:hypothetical protein CC86DRAFT_94038 [Ophiobolus disseminans]
MKHDNPSFGPLAAAATVAYWGLWIAFFQTLICARKRFKPREVRKQAAFYILTLGTVMPCTALLSFLWSAHAAAGTSNAGFVLVILPDEEDRRTVSLVLGAWMFGSPVLVALAMFGGYLLSPGVIIEDILHTVFGYVLVAFLALRLAGIAHEGWTVRILISVSFFWFVGRAMVSLWLLPRERVREDHSVHSFDYEIWRRS